MKFLELRAVVTAMATASCLVLGTVGANAATFEFSQVVGTPKDRFDYNPLLQGSVGASRLTVTFTGEDRNGDGLLTYFKYGYLSEITAIKATWDNLEFKLDNLWTFVAGRLPAQPANFYGEDILLHEFRFYKGDVHMDLKPFGGLYEWYEQFRAYRCPATLNCLDYPSIDYPIADGKMSGDYLLGFENIFVPGFPAYKSKHTPDGQPVKSTPEPSAIAGLTLLALAGWKQRRAKVSG
ncbi:hypothetical protein [Oscillatoria sp. FACHB-1406]|uniref:hypothetical protein n=1 Tax=Oscillatoria sp. FACHB-1406 TaxID=2692846 RepID=UPI001689DDBF|nr:hypothetical protein [Oscillatoria sp. FACHB-1406]MBD2580270.1 hypothetical protein [Oscillatoria sp. FACHB-1406]